MLLMAAKTRKSPSVATCAVRLIQRGLHPIVFIQEVGTMISRYERGNIGVAFFAGKRWVDLGMADQTIGHLREDASRCDIFGLFDTVVAAGAVVGGIEMGWRPVRRVLFAGDGRAQNGRYVAELSVQLVVKVGHLADRWSLYCAAIRVARLASRRRGQIVVVRFRALRDGLVARHARKFQCQMPPMRERFVLRTRGACQK